MPTPKRPKNEDEPSSLRRKKKCLESRNLLPIENEPLIDQTKNDVENQFQCDKCPQSFGRQLFLNRHIADSHLSTKTSTENNNDSAKVVDHSDHFSIEGTTVHAVEK